MPCYRIHPGIRQGDQILEVDGVDVTINDVDAVSALIQFVVVLRVRIALGHVVVGDGVCGCSCVIAHRRAGQTVKLIIIPGPARGPETPTTPGAAPVVGCRVLRT